MPDTALILPIPAIWAAMDCPGVWTVDAALEPMLVGRMTGELAGDFDPGAQIGADDFVVVGEYYAREGCKMLTSTAVYRTDGTLVAHAEQVWISVTA